MARHPDGDADMSLSKKQPALWERHNRIVGLRAQGWTLEMIRVEMGMKDHTGVMRHLSRCKCRPPNGGCSHDFRCTECGAAIC